LERLPPRYLRGLDGLLDHDERVIYTIERPPAVAGGLVERTLRSRDRRAALLLLTDRQLIWMVDHVPPDRYLLDWGVDARLVAIEALRAVELRAEPGRQVQIQVGTAGGRTGFPLPEELTEEAQVMADLLQRFVPDGACRQPVRRYSVEETEFDPEGARRFGQENQARELIAALSEAVSPEPPLGAFYAPRRERVREVAAVVVTRGRVALSRDGRSSVLRLADLVSISLALSPLVGRLELEAAPAGRRSAPGLTYPAPLSSWATPFIRLLRRAWANAASGAEP
jgi:hypothetical protein